MKGMGMKKMKGMDKVGRALKTATKDAKGRAMKQSATTGFGGVMAMKKGGKAAKKGY